MNKKNIEKIFIKKSKKKWNTWTNNEIIMFIKEIKTKKGNMSCMLQHLTTILFSLNCLIIISLYLNCNIFFFFFFLLLFLILSTTIYNKKYITTRKQQKYK